MDVFNNENSEIISNKNSDTPRNKINFIELTRTILNDVRSHKLNEPFSLKHYFSDNSKEKYIF